MVWKPRVVVASVLAVEGKYLMVEEIIQGKPVLNQPAGHLEYGESLIDAAVRETLEETGYRYTPTAFLGAFLLPNPDPDRVYLRMTFTGNQIEAVSDVALDPAIKGVHWLTEEEIRQHPHLTPRNELVLESISRHRQQAWYPLSLVDMK